MRRYRSIDIMRTIAIAFMVLCHFTIYLAPEYESAHAIFFLIADHGVGDLAAPFFIFLAGMSQQISYQKHAGDKSMFKFRNVVYGIVLFLFGLLFEGAVWGFEHTFGWDVLTLIATAVILLFFLRRVPIWILIAMVSLILVVTPALRSTSHYLGYWGGELVNTPYVSNIIPGILQETVGEYEASITMIEMLRGFFLNGFFPFFPWIMYALCGFTVGRLVTGHDMKKRVPLIVSIGCVLVASSFSVAFLGAVNGGSAVSDFIAPYSFYPMSSSLSMLTLGFCLVLFPLLWLAFDSESKLREAGAKPAPGYFSLLGKYSLTVYVLHHMLIMWPVRIAGYINNTDYYMNTINSSLVAFSTGAIFLILIYPVLLFVDTRFRTLTFERLLAALTQTLCALLASVRRNQGNKVNHLG